MSGAAFRFPQLQSHDPDSLGGFRLVARLGEGGMGQVFLAFSPGGQPAAMKVIREEFARDAEFGQRFAREVAAAQKVRGAHLAPLLDADPRARRPWLATMYVTGPSLRELVVGHGPLPAGQVMLLAWGIAHALADIHAVDVVHRDLKPGNIILDESGPKVIDFGIVKSLAQSVTYASSSTRIGTPLYMSPEQAVGRAVGAACDVFALGSTLYFLATGREAFAAENEWAVAHRVVADDPDVSAVAPPLRRLITACLRKDPGRRPTPAGVLESCEAELGDALGPGAWMGITSAREAIRQRTSALHTLTAPGIATGAERGGARSWWLIPSSL
ncbi:serine/threonine-protein kinase [Kitasatospora sp. NPDC018058]|uniref:serine/threonine-protein kinase n=1 Tax=Kitasatospora sp. NPDC018058 TaxID=3364025 RepID=UPI0037BEC2B8